MHELSFYLLLHNQHKPPQSLSSGGGWTTGLCTGGPSCRCCWPGADRVCWAPTSSLQPARPWCTCPTTPPTSTSCCSPASCQGPSRWVRLLPAILTNESLYLIAVPVQVGDPWHPGGGYGKGPMNYPSPPIITIFCRVCGWPSTYFWSETTSEAPSRWPTPASSGWAPWHYYYYLSR